MTLQLKRLNLLWTVETRATHTETAEEKEERQYALLFLSSSIEDPRVLDMLDRYTDPCALWQAIERRHTPVSRQESRAILASLYTAKQADNEKVDDYITRLYKLRTQYLKCGGIEAAVSEGMMAAMTIGTAEYIRDGIGSREVSWKQNSGNDPTFEEVCEWATAMESTRTASKTPTVSQDNFAGTAQSSARKNTHQGITGAATVECNNCKRTGHFARDCPNIDRLTANAQQVKEGWCPLKGHLKHKAADCKSTSKPDRNKSSEGLFDDE